MLCSEGIAARTDALLLSALVCTVSCHNRDARRRRQRGLGPRQRERGWVRMARGHRPHLDGHRRDPALAYFRDRLGPRVERSEVIEAVRVRLTYLDLGNAYLQLVEPLGPGQAPRRASTSTARACTTSRSASTTSPVPGRSGRRPSSRQRARSPIRLRPGRAPPRRPYRGDRLRARRRRRRDAGLAATGLRPAIPHPGGAALRLHRCRGRLPGRRLAYGQARLRSA